MPSPALMKSNRLMLPVCPLKLVTPVFAIVISPPREIFPAGFTAIPAPELKVIESLLRET
jgi:hypothetical protein